MTETKEEKKHFKFSAIENFKNEKKKGKIGRDIFNTLFWQMISV